jgi:hypothetical protein
MVLKKSVKKAMPAKKRIMNNMDLRFNKLINNANNHKGAIHPGK